MGNVLQIAPAATLRIGDLAKRTNKSPRAVRLYEEMGLLGPVFRTEGGHRVYDENVLVRMSWIDKLQGLGFSLTQIKDLLHEWADSKFGPTAMSKVRATFRDKLEETRVQLRQLESLAEELHESLSYLESCEVCAPCTVLGECAECGHPHPIDDEPSLVAGFHVAAGQARRSNDV